MAIARDNPYIWVTWITALLAGDSHCEWSAWFRTHYTGYVKQPTDFNLAAWKAEHGEMVRAHVSTLKHQGYTVYVEQQNKFSLKGKAATLGGIPDIVAARDSDFVVVDCKTGQQRDADLFQVLIYVLVLPITHVACLGRRLTGEIHYSSDIRRIEPHQLNDARKQQIRTLIERVGGNVPLPRVPSFGTCRFCDISSRDCPDRMDQEPQQITVNHDLF